VLFLPQIVKQFGLTNVQTGFVSALPFFGALIGILLWARASDRTGARSTLNSSRSTQALFYATPRLLRNCRIC
jgi:MFS family permease